jgi:hypothetical protein
MAKRFACFTQCTLDEFSNHIIRNKNVLIKHGQFGACAQIPIFEAEKIYIRDSDKNFILYHLRHCNFPKVREIYLADIPGAFDIYTRFPSTTKFYLTENHREYVDKFPQWDPIYKQFKENVFIRTNDEFKEEWNSGTEPINCITKK